MPLHDFVCRLCGHAFEALVMGGEQPSCPVCGSLQLDKKMSAFVNPGRSSKGGDDSGGGKCSGCAGGN